MAQLYLLSKSIAAGDLNNDGIPDLAVVSDSDGILTYAVGKGDGTFLPWKYGPSGAAPIFVTLADVSQDGNLDALTSDATENDVAVAFGNGDANFPKAVFLNSPRIAVNPIAVADLNSDGIPDIVETNSAGGSFPGSVFVLLGKGNGRFGRASSVASGGYGPWSIAVGDLNHDNIPDLVIADVGKTFSKQFGGLTVFLGNGDGTFRSPVGYPAGVYPYQLVLGDFNGDQNLDVAVVGVGSDSRVRVLLGNGDGTLSPAKYFQGGPSPISIVAADFNGDGKLDLAVCNYASPDSVSILLGNGDGTFQPPVKFPVGMSPEQLVVADFNRDGKPDIAVVNGGDSTVSVLLNTTTFPVPAPLH